MLCKNVCKKEYKKPGRALEDGIRLWRSGHSNGAYDQASFFQARKRLRHAIESGFALGAERRDVLEQRFCDHYIRTHVLVSSPKIISALFALSNAS
jgi:hypothetical protein